ncbi:aromatic amino acid lyase [Arthrobacter sp. efr-133-TYG-118]|uniref:aromatic amino acid lyase n=1 Tax=Arthrobacter sp. efr-133-TYG-118 TaxID=3040279 RepID=UPI00254F7019|nr:aromatic amino acid lyase [Arthrobacter sp. efr-133-TYG-118]
MIVLSGSTTTAEIVAIARRRAGVAISSDVIGSIRLAHEEAAALSARIPTYGRSTGFGANKATQVDGNDLEHGMRLLRSSAVDSGTALAEDAVRSMLAVRLSQLCTPGAGLEDRILPALATMLNSNSLPTIREFGSIGTADLSALCGTALTLLGERAATGPLDPMAPWGKDSALPFVSSNALTIGRAVLAAHDLRQLVDAALMVYVLTFTGLSGNPSPFSAAAAKGTAAEDVDEFAQRMRNILGSGHTPSRIQDPYGLRAFLPSTIGLINALDKIEALLSRLIVAAQENPLFVYDENGRGASVEHSAGFHQAPLSLALDGVKIALAQTIPLSMSRIRMMTDPEYTLLNPFLAVGADSASGIMTIEYVVASAYGAIHTAAHPSSLATVVLSRGTEEDASFASEGVVQLERAVHSYRSVVAGELIIATRLLRQRGLLPSDMHSRAASDAYELALSLPQDDSDRDQRKDLDSAEAILEELALLGR